jgi:hypothetical protein
LEKNLTVLNCTRQPDFEAGLRLQIQGTMEEINLSEEEAISYLMDSYARLHQALMV